MGEGLADEEEGAAEENPLGVLAGKGEGGGEAVARGAAGEGGEGGGGEGAWVIHGEAEDSGGEGEEGGDDAGHVFIGEDSEEEGGLFAGEFFAPCLGELLGGVGIVRAVEDEAGVFCALESARPFAVGEGFGGGAGIGADACFDEGGEGEGGVPALVAAAE